MSVLNLFFLSFFRLSSVPGDAGEVIHVKQNMSDVSAN